MITFIKKFAVLTLQCLWFLALGMGILSYLERPPGTQGGSREILNPDKKVAPGETLRIAITAPLTKDCDGEVERVIADSTGREYAFAREPRPDKDSYVAEVIVPLGVYPGPAKYWARRYWKCNWIQYWFPNEDKQPVLEFEIAPAEGQLPMPQQQGVYEAPLRKSDLARIPQ